MNFKYVIKSAFESLKTHKSRSALTILGIVIGITSIVFIMAIGKGAQQLILSEIEGLGAKSLVIIPGREPKGMIDSFDSFFSDSLKQREVEALSKKSNVPDMAKIMPVVFGSASISNGGEIYRGTFLGASELAEKVYSLNMEKGFFFNEEDVKSRASVIVIGNRVKEELFGDSEAINQIVRIKGRNFRIVGLIEKQGAGAFLNFDDVALAPYTTAQQYIFGIKHFHRVMIEARTEESVYQMAEDIKITLRNLHNIEDEDKDDFYIQTQEDIANTVGTITSVMTLFLAAVAAVSLIVGGVGIMNIMLVSVVERTREIGLRKAIGATKKDILIQFLVEAVALTSLGGLIGIFFGTVFSLGASVIIAKLVSSGWAFIFPFGPAILGLGVSAFIGLVFGLYPANQASKKSPIEALRYE